MNWQYSIPKWGFLCVVEASVVERIVCGGNIKENYLCASRTENNRFDFIKEV